MNDINNFRLAKVDLNDLEMVKAIGDLIYLTDPYIYPDMFEGDILLAEKLAYKLLSKETLFNYKNIKVAMLDNKVAGFMIIIDKYPSNNSELIRESFMEIIGKLPPRLNNVISDYFEMFANGWVGTQIMSLAVKEEFRNKKVATRMLNSLDNNTTYSLACIKDNEIARRLYAHCGFELLEEYVGYTNIMCVELVKKGQ